MFLEENIIEFVNKIINESKEEEKEIKENIEKFKEYLILTKMAKENTIEWLNRVIICLPELMSLKKKLKTIDVRALVDYDSIIVSTINKPKKRNLTKAIEKHYHHYETNSSSSCGGGSVTRSGC